MSQIFGQMHSSQFENMMNSNTNEDYSEMDDGNFIFENLKLIQKRNKLYDLEDKLSEIASFNQIEFVHLLN